MSLSHSLLLFLVFLSSACGAAIEPNVGAVDIDAGHAPAAEAIMPSMSDRVDFQALDAGRWIILDRRDLWRTEDGGKTWIRAYHRASGGIRGTSGGLSFYDAANGFAILDDNLLRTDDGGKSWSVVAETEVGVKSIFFADGSLGWAAGSEITGGDDEIPGLYEVGRIWKTEDGGRSWKRMNVAPPKELLDTGYHKWELRDIHFVDRSTGWVVGRATVYRTNDGGRTWTPHPFGASIDARRIHFINADIGWVQTVNGAYYATANGGKKWDLLNLPKSLSYENSAIAVTAEKEWMFLSENGKQYRSRDINEWNEIGQPGDEAADSTGGLNGYAYASQTFDGQTVLIWAEYEDGEFQQIRSFVRPNR